MLHEHNLRNYQRRAIDHLLEHPYAGLFLDMGLGKTVSTLTAVNAMLLTGQAGKVLIVAPKRVAESVWHTEAAQWSHLKHLSFSLVLGPERRRKEALQAKADIYVTTRDLVCWLQAYCGSKFPFDTVIIDELSSFKHAKSARFKALRMLRPQVKRVIGLTGTPMPNGLLDLWPQLYLLDMGERLGKTIGQYRDKYFNEGKRNGHVVYSYNIKREKGNDLLGEDIYEREIYSKISDICISMKAEDYLELPKRIDQDVVIELPPAEMKQYLEFERDQVLALAGSGEITAMSAAALTNKLLQYANGAVYKADKEQAEPYVVVHDLKISALEQDLEAANGNPFLLFYQYKHDVERITHQLKEYKPRLLQNADDILAWNRKEIPFMLAHPASAGHGLNLQAGGHLLGWFGLPWSLELYLQGVGRLDRQGQPLPVVNRRYIVKGTMDEDVAKAIERKQAGQDALMEAVKARISKYLSVTPGYAAR